jgi:hypothetical protein
MLYLQDRIRCREDFRHRGTVANSDIHWHLSHLTEDLFLGNYTVVVFVQVRKELFGKQEHLPWLKGEATVRRLELVRDENEYC